MTVRMHHVRLKVPIQEVRLWTPDTLSLWIQQHVGEDVYVKREQKDRRLYLVMVIADDAGLERFREALQKSFELL
ncbi:hypothetical protein [Deinococcus cellulosilyticus]|uniref:Uncharacterized protein n=1 Tax=Deinococcus cellulosilyticus (strain DSM 18568 / NBRC 106333 / KACC 11606 / 5516J-15) TaxID=1223518 RepID=A0A511N084_DEIC1|nr:hypothetical protein [Deinococcus cellulosilyticus]GEM46252.1 hypothetical protein DC3_18870 [Deinococcus cellulosilyticus NBRC 106333 = KACC 11606]